MCDQTEVTYSTGDVVWVKLGPVWWPGQVQDYDKLPEEITSNLRKKPIAVVKFFQEDTFEYVKNLNQIYQYNCRKKEEFIKKGLDMVRNSNSREVPSNMKMFPNDIVMAEHLTGGDPNILDSKTFAPEQKSDYSDLFGTKKLSAKKLKAESLKKELKSRRHSGSPLRIKRQSLPTLPSTIPRPITHPRFITKALEGKSDHEVRIRCQTTPKSDDGDASTEKKYKCHLCDFQSVRLNVIVLHNKSHSASFIEAQNTIRARLKFREREYATPLNSLSEHTSTTVTSRGRVKSLPKKLMDYTDEPPPKILKERVSSSSKLTLKEEMPESPVKNSTEKSPTKTPKILKVNPEKVSIKRPLFGKRKTAKEKAEIAAKQKQENEAMKETLLKDWDDDDVNQEEVELERLKLALESTTSSMDMDDSNTSLKDDEVNLSMDVHDKVIENAKEKQSSTEIKPIDVKRDINSKIFEFDDSEDSLPVTINFRLKNQREKFTDDKFKKPKPPKPLSKISSKAKPPVPSNPIPTEKKTDDKETAELNEAFNALLEETVVPVLPEIPVTGFSKSSSSPQISDQTSDISSSTDLMEVTESTETSAKLCNKVSVDVSLDSCVINDDLKMECTSSDGEEIKSNDISVFDSEIEKEIKEDQKNAEEVSACDPRVGMDVDLILTGVATTTTEDVKVALELLPEDKGKETPEDSMATEISSTCDVTKVCEDSTELSKVERFQVLSPMKKTEEQDNFLNRTENSDVSMCFDSEEKVDNVTDLNTPVEKSVDIILPSDCSEILNEKESSKDCEIQKFNEKSEDTATNYFPSDTEVSVVNKGDTNGNTEYSVETKTLQVDVPNENLLPETVTTFSNAKITENLVDTGITKEETIPPQQTGQEEIVKDEVIQQTTTEADQIISPQINNSLNVAPTDNIMNVQLILPVDTENKTGNVQLDSQPPHTIKTIETLVQSGEILGGCKLENQTLSQSLQDMELDINSMPVIIGGEDFIQPEQPKQTLVPIQPKYSESIVISPKTKISSPKKTESIIMQLGEPSTSNQNVQSVISIPSKGGRGGGRGGRSQKTTSKTIKLTAGALKNLGSLQKGGNQQVLILKTAGGQDKQDQGVIQKNKGPLNMFQHGNKILIVNNPQMSGQNKIKLNPQQQQLLSVSGGKLAPGTRVFTSKVVATTTAQASVTGTSKISTSRSSSKPTQKLVISKGGILTNTSKSVIINNSGKLVTTMPATHAITTSKGQTLITQNVLNTKGSLILPSSSQSVSTGKTATIITSQALTTSKGMILTPITSKGGTIISGNQKLRIVSSKAPLSGTRLVVQNPQGKLKIDPQHKNQQVKLIRGQSTGNTILIQTSQGIVAKSITSSSTSTAQSSIKASEVVKTVMTTVPTQTKIRVTTPSPHQQQVIKSQIQTQIVQQPQIIQQSKVQHAQIVKAPPVKKVAVQKIRPSPNILQKPQRKSTARTPKSAVNRLITPAVSSAEPIILSTTSSIPVIAQPTLVQGQVSQGSEGLVYLTVDEAGNYRQIDNKSLISLEGNSSEAPRTIFIPADTRPQDVGNIFLAIDDAGNIVNITQRTPNNTFTAENAAPSQDILAKALANTQVLQQETILPDMDVSAALSSTPMDSAVISSSSFNDQALYPASSLTHGVVETSLTLNQPIMTPLEVPSAVTPNIGQISSLSSNYITPNLLTPKQKNIRPSMPLLTEESLANQTRGEPVFFLDNSNNIIPATSGSQISFQLTLGDNNVIMTSGTGGEILSPTYQVVSGDLLTSELVAAEGTHGMSKVESVGSENVDNQENVKFESSENVTFSILPQAESIPPETSQMDQHSVILREALEAPHQTTLKGDNFLNSVEVPPSDSLGATEQVSEDSASQLVDPTEQECAVEKSEQENYAVQLSDSFEDKNVNPVLEEVKHSLKRSLGEEQMVSSSSDLEDDSKRVRLDER